jgi:hypothetical protein
VASKASKRRRKRRRQGTAKAEGPRAEGGEVPAAPPSRRRRVTADEPPPAPWGSFPLIELTVLVGIVMLVLGFFFVGGDRGAILIGTGLLLGSIGGLELSIREHFAGYRSHTLILAGLPAAIVLGVLFYAGPSDLPPIARAGIGAAVFALTAVGLTRVFRDRSGGQPFRFSGLRRR